MTFRVTRFHDISCGHRIYKHKSRCAHLHGHNYRIHFTCEGPISSDDMVIDFSDIKSALCTWLDNNWDHKFLLWDQDPLYPTLKACDPLGVIAVPFNPTAENMAYYLVEVLGKDVFKESPIRLVEVLVQETAKSSALYSLV